MHFNAEFYTQYLSKGEKHDRDWLVYSKDVDKVFYFCCKLFKKGPLKGQLANEGYKDWTHLNVRLKEHENNFDHILNMTTWIDLHLRLQKNETIDKVVQFTTQINLSGHVKSKLQSFKKSKKLNILP